MELIQGGAGGLSVLRTFRLLRILKLVRFLPALQYQLKIMLRTLDNVPTFLALLILFIFIFRFYRLFALFLRILNNGCVIHENAILTKQPAWSTVDN